MASNIYGVEPDGRAMGLDIGAIPGAIGNGLGAVSNWAFGKPQIGGADQDKLRGYADQWGSNTAPTAQDAFSKFGYGQFRGQQSALANMLQEQAMGRGPSLAGEQARQVGQQGIAAQGAMASGARGPMAGLAQRNAAANSANITSGLAGTAAQARLGEILAARQQLAGVLQGARGQDLQGQGMWQQNQQFNVGANQNQQGLNQSGVLGAYGLTLGAQQAAANQPSNFDRAMNFGANLGGAYIMGGVGRGGGGSGSGGDFGVPRDGGYIGGSPYGNINGYAPSPYG